MTASDIQDAVIVGGSYAGLTAALQLARARRRVTVIDAGQPRNRFASHAHGVLALDGHPGWSITAAARAQISAYETTTLRQGQVIAARAHVDGFEVSVAEGPPVHARRLVLAHGVQDVLPDLPGVEERWGRTALHCPWCHGHEVGLGPIGVLWRGPLSTHYAEVVAEWGEATLFMEDGELDPEAAARLARRGVRVEMTRLAGLEGSAPALDGARLVDGRFMPLKAMFVGASVRQPSDLAETLGCAFEDTPMGRIVKVDAMQQTTRPGVFAAGDMARAAGNITWAMTDGMSAGHGVFRSLIEEEMVG